MSAPVKASPEDVTGVALAVAVAVPGVAVAGVVKTPAGVIVTSVVATFVPAPGFVPLATKVLTVPYTVATTGSPLRETDGPDLAAKVSTKVPVAGAFG